MHIHLPGRIYDFNHFHPEAFAFVSEQSLPSFPMFFVLSGLFLDDMFTGSLTSPSCSYRLELHLCSLPLLY